MRAASHVFRAAALAAALVAATGAAAGSPRALEPELGRLVGHDVVVCEQKRGYAIRDVAGEGAPRIGIVERRGDELWLESGEESLRLEGPLAVPRIAGPNYKVWIIGDARGDALYVRRIGILAPPRARGAGDGAARE